MVSREEIRDLNPDDPREPSDEELQPDPPMTGPAKALFESLDQEWAPTPYVQTDSFLGRMWRDRDRWKIAVEANEEDMRSMEAKIADLEERNANQVQKIGTLKSSLAQMTRAHDAETGMPIDTRTYADKPKTAGSIDWMETDRAIDKIVPWLRKIFEPAPGGDAAQIIDAVEELISQATTYHVPTWTVHGRPIEGLELWWMQQAQAEVEPLIAKMTEYGGGGRAVDLTEIGSALRIAGVGFGKEHRGQPTEGDTQELGVYFYLVGKFARWTAAIAENRPVSDDTLSDIGIYVRMAQRIRESGGWPS